MSAGIPASKLLCRNPGRAAEVRAAESSAAPLSAAPASSQTMQQRTQRYKLCHLHPRLESPEWPSRDACPVDKG